MAEKGSQRRREKWASRSNYATVPVQRAMCTKIRCTGSSGHKRSILLYISLLPGLTVIIFAVGAAVYTTVGHEGKSLARVSFAERSERRREKDN